MLTAAQRYLLNRLNSGARDLLLGNLLSNQMNTVKGLYDFSVQGGAQGTINLDDTLNEFGATGDITIPDNSIVWSGIADVVTDPTSGGSATVALGLNTTTDILGATAIASVTGLLALVPVGTAATAVKMTAAQTLDMTIGTADLTAGYINVYLQYWAG